MEPKERLLKQLPNNTDLLAVKPVYDVANNVLHYQTDPYLDSDGKVKVKRLGSVSVEVVQAFHTVEEVTKTESY